MKIMYVNRIFIDSVFGYISRHFFFFLNPWATEEANRGDRFSCSVVYNSVAPDCSPAALSMRFPRHKYWSGLLFRSPGVEGIGREKKYWVVNKNVKPLSPYLSWRNSIDNVLNWKISREMTLNKLFRNTEFWPGFLRMQTLRQRQTSCSFIGDREG